MKTGVEIGPGLATMTIYLLLLIIDGTLVMFNLMQFHSLIRLCSRLFVRFLVLSFLPSFIFTTEGFKSFAQIHITESDCRIT